MVIKIVKHEEMTSW